MKKIKFSKKIIFILIVLIQVIYHTVSFGVNKQGYHSDEMWNYGFAISTDEKNLYYVDEDKGIYKYIYSWTDSEVLHEYITVDKSEIFAYDSIYKNLEKDLNPPLQFMILHFICSFFVGKWSKWFGFIINIFSFILIQIYLFKFMKRVTKSDAAAYMGIVVFGFAVGSTSVTTFLRMYALGVAFAMMFIYYVNEIYICRDEREKYRTNIIKAAIALLLGALTVHQFLIMAFFVVFIYSLYYLFSKRFRLMLTFGISMLASVGVSVILFPSTFSHLFGYTNNSIIKKYPTGWQFRIYLSFLTKDISGFHISAIRTMAIPYTFVGLVILVFILVPLCFVLRNEEKFKTLVIKIKERMVYGVKNIKKIPFTIIALLFVIVLFVLVDAHNYSIFRMGIFAKRYMFLIYPVYAAFVCMVIYYFFRWLIQNCKVRNIVLLLTGVLMVVITYFVSRNPFYLKHYEEGITLDALGKDANFIAVMSSDWVLVSGANELYDTNSYFLTDYATYDKMNYKGADPDKPLYLLLDVSELVEDDVSDAGSDDDVVIIDENGNTLDEKSIYNSYKRSKIINYFEDLEICTKFERVGTDEMFERVIEIYRLN